MSITAVLAVLVAPILIRWSFVLANRPSSLSNKFRPSPPLRVVYPGGLIMFGWATLYYVALVLDPKQAKTGWDFLALVLSILFLGMTLYSWPVVVEVSEGGLTWHKLLRRRFVKWADVEDVSTDMDGALVIYGRDGLRIQVNQYTEGRPDLKRFVEAHKPQPHSG